MTENFNQAWLLLGVGMLTVFVILWLVVLIGNAIILFVNRFVPVSQPAGLSSAQKEPGNIESAKMALIIAAVHSMTGGRGRIVKIERK